MTFELEKRHYDQHGFVIVRQLLGAPDFTKLKENLDRYIRDVVPGLPDADAFYQDRSRPETLKQMQRMGGEPAAADQPEWFNKPPATHHVTPPHQDNYYFCLEPTNVLTMWMALDPVDAENGCLRYVDGSHTRGYRKHAKSQILGFSQGIMDYTTDDFNREVAAVMQPGDVAVHHGMTIHRADANLSQTRDRRSFAMVFRGDSCQRDETGFARYSASAREQHSAMGLKT
ncbi:MAG: phytanoyl-CoA dioxygenase family protein [Planctomycetota bacterium]|nr:phytanoyl-CoA dioxygenase family protein [Planctomycetota bacterium]